ncbi:MAG TPA: hypothetical protein VMJ65_08955 [Solirubrobacteraceae bacterium]|nr:hypothetical protein [Solirubrobacteraceae bacterium]
MSRESKTVAVSLATGLCMVAIAAPALAKSEKVVSGHATVRASIQIASFLRSRGITVSPIGPAKISAGAMTMPMVGGTVSVPTMNGTMNAQGGLEYRNGNKIVRVRSYVLSHKAGNATLTAIVNGHRIVIATMSSPNVHMSGKHATMSGGLHISAAWAKLINHLVGLHVVHAGETIGQLSMKVKMA